jgi:hypothetical protein
LPCGADWQIRNSFISTDSSRHTSIRNHETTFGLQAFPLLALSQTTKRGKAEDLNKCFITFRDQPYTLLARQFHCSAVRADQGLTVDLMLPESWARRLSLRDPVRRPFSRSEPHLAGADDARRRSVPLLLAYSAMHHEFPFFDRRSRKERSA